MKTYSKFSLTLFSFSVILLSVFSSCKTETVEPNIDNEEPEEEEPVTPINAVNNDLLDYFFTIELEGSSNNLRILYFQEQENDDILAILDGVDSRRDQVVNVQDSIFQFDVNGDQAFVYTFKISKDSIGHLDLVSYELKSNNQNIKLIYLQMSKVEDVQPIEGLTYFKEEVDPTQIGLINYYLNFPEKDFFRWATSADFDSVKPSSCYTISRGAWKGNNVNNNIDFMGVSVPAWKDSSEPVMILTLKSSNTLDIYEILN